MSHLTATDFPCPVCGSGQGVPCASLGGGPKKAGELTTNPHEKRQALVPKRKREPKCGTYAAAQSHKRRGEKPCQPCRDALAAYMRDYREQNPVERANEKRMNAARGRALWRLAAVHPDEFRRLVQEEAKA